MTKISRNAPCPCGSGKKYKKCCLQNNEAERIDIRKAAPNPKEAKQSTFDRNQFAGGVFI